MNKRIWWAMSLLSLSGTGCASRPAGEVKVAPVNFVHADEKVERPGYIILADRRIFATMAFLNAVGYDEEKRGFRMHPVRRRVRQAIAKNLETHPEKLATWRQYWRKRQIPPFACKSYALSLKADYPFRRVRPDEELGYPHAAAALRGFPDILNDFWRTAKLEEIWTDVKPDYMAAVRTYDP